MTETKERTEPVTFKSPEKQLKLPIFLKSFSSRVLLNPWKQEFWVNRRGWLTNKFRDGKITLSNNYWSKKDRTTSKTLVWGAKDVQSCLRYVPVVIKTFFIVNFVLTKKWPSVRQVRVTVDPDPIIDVKIALGYIEYLLKDNNLNFYK